MSDHIVNKVWLLALKLQRKQPDWSWDVCCEVAFQQNRLNNGYS